ncbi:hypothetical protein KBY75_07930 [Cyanobium sp. T1G-Tous]|uniref:hypothetical protein n=1 Tax=unclassified Cyanobium TaxID=2627006 RepID=UPI0020CCF996|nr:MULTISPECIES: hypothetical protein [unclassified Cyanobium]MCP9803494.1 hypothetical protein [Cyanobium sp. T1G-Tous]MCP9806888.1 hypothetical protein [Cyanobium sp. T1B-Tous]MCP9875784.1 hypothetical protein [Cyanobium sp. A2C-AMD]
MTGEEKLFNAAALIYLKDREGVTVPSPEKSHIGNSRITLRSADGQLLAHIPSQQAKDALTSGRFGDLEGKLSSLVKRRAEEKAREKEERGQKLLELKAKASTWLKMAKEKLNLAKPPENGGRTPLIKAGVIALGGVATVWGINFISLQAPLNSVISSDYRNSGIKASASYQWMINPGVLVFSVDEASSASPADVSRILLQYAERLEGRKFTSVLLAQKGKPIFLLKGDYFKQLGDEYGVQNVIYTLRTMPENVYELDGSPAFSSWSGGWLGVVGQQFDDLNDFHRRWLVDEP